MLVGQSDLDGVEVLALDVLHESHLHHALILDGAYVGRYGLQPSQLRGAPASLAGEDLEAVRRDLPEGDGLDDANLADASRQFLQAFLIEVVARLVGIGLYLVEGNLVDGRRSAGPRRLGGDERVEATS